MLTPGQRRVRWEKLIKVMCDGNVPAAKMAKHMNLSEEQLAELFNDRQIRKRLGMIVKIDRIREQVFTGHWRTSALTRLLAIAQELGKGETARRACADFVKAEPKRSAARKSDKSSSGPPVPVIDQQAADDMRAMLAGLYPDEDTPPGKEETA